MASRYRFEKKWSWMISRFYPRINRRYYFEKKWSWMVSRFYPRINRRYYKESYPLPSLHRVLNKITESVAFLKTVTERYVNKASRQCQGDVIRYPIIGLIQQNWVPRINIIQLTARFFGLLHRVVWWLETNVSEAVLPPSSGFSVWSRRCIHCVVAYPNMAYI
jgi:hypothetical protein